MLPIDRICVEKKGCSSRVLERAIELAVEIAREGREGRKIGTLLVVADEENVLSRSHCLILDPLLGHPKEKKRICDPNMRETIKELALLDGAFVISGNGIVLSAARYINASAENLDLPLGLGSRHVAAASISRETEAVAVAVSESSVVRVFNGGRLVAEIIPEVWLFSRHSIKIEGPLTETTVNDVRIVAAAPQQSAESGCPRRTHTRKRTAA